MAKIDELDLEELLPDGRKRYQLLESGAVRDVTTNRFVARRITTDEARAMVQTRWDKWRKANASAILKEAQAIDPSIKTEQEALAMAAGKTFVAILESDIPRGDDLMKLAQLAGAHPTAADVRGVPDTEDPVTVSINAEGMKMLLDLITSDREVIDAEAEDV